MILITIRVKSTRAGDFSMTRELPPTRTTEEIEAYRRWPLTRGLFNCCPAVLLRIVFWLGGRRAQTLS